ncbi:MAG: hypothetical protein ACPLQO_00165 [Desulfotomaculales bacterium]
MNGRNWQADWDWVNSPDVFNLSERAQEMLIYWLQWARELEEENRRLRAVAEAAREFFNCCGCLHYSEDSYSNTGYSWDCNEDYCPLDKIRQALSALDGGKKGDAQ